MKLKDMPKVELHLHLDGSLSKKIIKEKYNLTDAEIENNLVANKKCTNLNDYLEKFNYPINILQTKEEISSAVINLLNDLKQQNVIYAEIRFAPQFHTKKGLTQEQVVQVVLDAKEKVDIKSNFILCLMRGKDNMDLNHETLKVAKKHINKGVCAIDLAGAEALYPTSNYQEIFKKAKEYNIPFTIHAGEAAGVDSIKDALSFGASRIGHGVRCIEDKDLIEYIIDNNITLEICPTSNIQTCICDSYKNHPITELYKLGVKTTINTDNMCVSDTNLLNEYTNLLKETDLTIDDIINMNENSINAAFISDDEKKQLLNKIKDR